MTADNEINIHYSKFPPFVTSNVCYIKQ